MEGRSDAGRGSLFPRDYFSLPWLGASKGCHFLRRFHMRCSSVGGGSSNTLTTHVGVPAGIRRPEVAIKRVSNQIECNGGLRCRKTAMGSMPGPPDPREGYRWEARTVKHPEWRGFGASSRKSKIMSTKRQTRNPENRRKTGPREAQDSRQTQTKRSSHVGVEPTTFESLSEQVTARRNYHCASENLDVCFCAQNICQKPTHSQQHTRVSGIIYQHRRYHNRNSIEM